MKDYLHGLKTIQEQGGKIIVGGKQLEREGNYIEPTSEFSGKLKTYFLVVEISHDAPIVKEELFVPILYVIKVKSLDEAIQVNNEGMKKWHENLIFQSSSRT